MTEQTTTTEPQDSVQVDLGLRVNHSMADFALDAVRSVQSGLAFAVVAIADPSTRRDGVEGYQVSVPPSMSDPDALTEAAASLRVIAQGLDRAAAQLTTTTPTEG